MDLKDVLPFLVILLAFFLKTLAGGKKRAPQKAAPSPAPIPVKKTLAAPKIRPIKVEIAALPPLKQTHVSKSGNQGSVKKKKTSYLQSHKDLKKGIILQQILKRHPDSF